MLDFMQRWWALIVVAGLAAVVLTVRAARARSRP